MEKPNSYYRRVLTGRYYFKPVMFGLWLVLLVEIEESYTDSENSSTESIKSFVKASIEDSFEIGLMTCNKIMP